MSEIKWEIPPKASLTKSARYDFAAALKSRPGEWAVLSEDAAMTTVAAIHSGRLVAFKPAGDFQATARAHKPLGARGTVWVRYVGPQL